MRPAVLLIAIAIACTGAVPAAGRAVPVRRVARHAPAGMAAIPAGSYRPLYAPPLHKQMTVGAFALDRDLVTRVDFLHFVRANPAWRRSTIRPVFAERGYLSDWPSDTDAGDHTTARRPITAVSWFAARAYCAAQGKRLPTTDEWEYVAAASETKHNANADAEFRNRLIALYVSRPRVTGFTNAYGIAEMHGPVWEWTSDFNGTVVGDNSHASGVDARDHHPSCASAAIGANDLTNYPAFLRAAMRAGLTGRVTLDGLGFRCAADLVT